jgi:hypothetical protein
MVAGLVGFVLAQNGGSHGRPRPPATQAAPPKPTNPATTAPTTPTTTAPPAALVATSTGTSTYRVGASAIITFRANNGTCWVEIRQAGPSGPVTFTGDILAGQSRAISSPVWVRLGNPGVMAITVNGTSISPPGMAPGEPYDLQFA